MVNRIKCLFMKFKESLSKIFVDDSTMEIDSNNLDDEEEWSFIEFLKNKLNFKNKKEIKVEKKTIEKKYINREQAIQIASLEKNFKRSIYREAIDNGYIYGIIELNHFYTTLVKYKGMLFWYVKVIDGKYGLRADQKNKKGYFDEYSNIRCLVNASTGKYIYIDEDIDTRLIRMITDDEFLNIIFDFKK